MSFWKRLRATNVQNSRMFADCSIVECGSGQQNQRDLVLILWAHNPKVGGSNPPPATKTLRSSFLQVPRIVKVASRAACMAFLVCGRVLVPSSKTWNNWEQIAENRLL